MVTKLNTYRRAIDIMSMIGVAVTNIRLYPPTSPIIRNTTDRLYHTFLEVFKQEPTVVFGESGKNFIICSHFFTEKDQERYPQAMEVLDLIQRLGVRSIAFDHRLSKPELKSFLELISRRPEEIESEGGFREVVTREHLPHITVDHKVYVVVDREQEIIASIEISEADVVQYVTGERELNDRELEKIKHMARDPRWVDQIFRAGIAFIMGQKAAESYQKLSELVVRMIQTLDRISGHIDAPETISKDLARSLADLDTDVLIYLLSQDIDAGRFGAKLIDDVVDFLDDDHFERILAMIRGPQTEQPADAEGAGEETSESARAGEAIAEVKRAGQFERLQRRLKRRLIEEKARRKALAEKIRSGMGGIIAGNTAPFSDDEIIRALPRYLLRLLENGRAETADKLLTETSRALTTTPPEIGDRIAQLLTHIGRMLLTDQRDDLMLGIVPHWAAFLREAERKPSLSYKRMCIQLGELAEHLVRAYRIAECNVILAELERICRGEEERHSECRQTACEVLEQTATPEMLDLLMAEFRNKEAECRECAIASLVHIGDTALHQLLEKLKQSRTMSERVRLLNAVAQVGPPIVEVITRHLREGGPWFFLRNLILVLGKIGGQESIAHLVPFLRHEDFRVQREALNSIFMIGGEQRGRILMESLDVSDDRIKPIIVDMLGTLRYEPAADAVIALLQAKSLFSKKQEEAIKERACVALGRILGHRAAVLLRSVVDQKGALGIRSYPESVRKVAQDVLSDLTDPEGTRAGAEGAGISGGAAAGAEIPAGGDGEGLSDVRTRAAALYHAIAEKIGSHQLDVAEALYEELMEMGSPALPEIIQAVELLQEARSEDSALNRDHLGIWPELYDMLSPEEADAMYDSLQEISFGTDQAVFRQGERNDRLWFVRKGRLKVIYQHGERVSLLKTVDKGDIMGEDTFFGISVCTTSLITLSSASLYYIERSLLDAWREKLPALQAKLHDYCLQMESVADLLKEKGIDRRVFRRVEFPGVAEAQLLDPAGKPAGKPFKGQLLDLSIGGLAFRIKHPASKPLNLLLGRRFHLFFELPKGMERQLEMETAFPRNLYRLTLSVVATVIGVLHLAGENYSIHVRFDTGLGDLVMAALRGEPLDAFIPSPSESGVPNAS